MSDYEGNPMYCKHLKGFDEDGDCKGCALESIYCAEQLSMRNVTLEAKVAELEKELDQTEALGRSILSDIVCEDYATAKKRAKLFFKDARK